MPTLTRLHLLTILLRTALWQHQEYELKPADYLERRLERYLEILK